MNRQADAKLHIFKCIPTSVYTKRCFSLSTRAHFRFVHQHVFTAACVLFGKTCRVLFQNLCFVNPSTTCVGHTQLLPHRPSLRFLCTCVGTGQLPPRLPLSHCECDRRYFEAHERRRCRRGRSISHRWRCVLVSMGHRSCRSMMYFVKRCIIYNYSAFHGQPEKMRRTSGICCLPVNLCSVAPARVSKE